MRFFLANLLGVTIDITVAISLIKIAALSTTVATSISITIAAVIMYFVHELWTFAGANQGLSGKRLVTVVASAFVALGTRALVLLILQKIPLHSDYIQYGHLIVAVSCSFLVNFILIRFIIERKAG